MRNTIQWTIKILILTLIVTLVDINIHRPQLQKGKEFPLQTVNLVIGASLVILVAATLIKAKNKT